MFIHANSYVIINFFCFEYFVIIELSNFCKKDKCSIVVVDLLTRNKLIKVKTTSPLTFFFKNFLVLKLTSKAAAEVVL